MAVIELHDLTKRFGDLVAVDHLSFEVESGRVVGFLGPNGAGKTTTLRLLLGLATALLTEPEILILDEPANGLDPEGVHWLRQLLRDLAAEGRTVLVSSHVLAEVAHSVDSVVILGSGRLVTHSTLDELTAGATRVVRVRTPRADELRLALEAEGAKVQQQAPDRLEVSAASPEQIGDLAAKRSIPIYESETGTTDLEDIFLKLTASTERTKTRQ